MLMTVLVAMQGHIVLKSLNWVQFSNHYRNWYWFIQSILPFSYGIKFTWWTCSINLLCVMDLVDEQSQCNHVVEPLSNISDNDDKIMNLHLSINSLICCQLII